MFSTIFKFEFLKWLRTPSFYIYCAVFFILSLLSTAYSLGVFTEATATVSSPLKVNSALSILGLISSFSSLVYFLIPTIIGAAVYRDFQTNMYQVLFSYPLTKYSYLLAKFLSAVCITLLIICSIYIGFIAAQFLPGVREDLLGPNNPIVFIVVLFVAILPNILLLGAIVFGLVTFSRNVYIGFIFILLLLIFQGFLQVFASNSDHLYTIALLDPFGDASIQYLTRYWTIVEKNTLGIPIEGVFLYNRLLWFSVAILVFSLVSYSFSFSANRFGFTKKSNGERVVKNNFGSIIQIKLPTVEYKFDISSRIKLLWNLSTYDFKFIVRNWLFLVIMLMTIIMVLFSASSTGEIFGTETLPVTWKMLENITSIYLTFLTILIFLFSGLLLHKAEKDRMNLIIAATATPNWVLYFSKYIALVRMMLLVLLFAMLSGIIFQIYKGYYHFEIGLYLKQLFGLNLLRFLVIAAFAFFIQSFFKNYLLGFMACILIIIVIIPLLPQIGIEQLIFIFNKDGGTAYSDMNGYGNLNRFFTYRLYWSFFGAIILIMGLLLYRRTNTNSFIERVRLIKQRLKPSVGIPLAFCVLAFLSLGGIIYYQNNVLDTYVSAKEQEAQVVDYEKKYKRYSRLSQPRIVDTKVDMNIFPESRDYNAKVVYTLINKSNHAIDTIFVNYNDNLQKLNISPNAKLVLHDSVLEVKIYQLAKALNPGDTLTMISFMKNKPNTFFKDKSKILGNGTFINNSIFPILGYLKDVELVDNVVRKKYNLPDKERMASVDDSLALQNTYISSQADWINFETVVSTSEDQIAIAPGYLIKEWTKDGRHYFHYKMDQKMLNFYSFISGRYAVKREKYKDVNLEIYYHPDHIYNLDRMMRSLKKSFAYYETEFSPYQFNQVRIIEFPKVHGTFAQAFANTIPFSEGFGFIAMVDDENPNAVDYPYSVTAHELAHQWWAHQVIGANVKGATMLSESLAEYSSLKVLEHTYGREQMRKYLKIALDEYLQSRSYEQIKENPLMYNEGQQHIHYQKGALVMYAMSDYLGEKKFNNFLKEYIKNVAFQEAPYTTSVEFVSLLKSSVPDSLQYLVKDMFETITFYDNKIESVKTKELPNGKYQIYIQFLISKYRAGDKGEESYEDTKGTSFLYKKGKEEIKSLPLKDYMEIAVFGAPIVKNGYPVDQEIFSKKYKVDKINNSISIIVDQKPYEIGVDPYNKLIDRNSDDNRMKI